MGLSARCGGALLALPLLGAATGCSHWPGGDGDDVGATPIMHLNVSNRVATPGSPYAIQVTWQAEYADNKTNGPGTTDPQTITRLYEGTVGEPGSPGPHGYRVSAPDSNCEVDDASPANPCGSMPALRAGTWEFTVSTDLDAWSTSCWVNMTDVGLGPIPMTFTHGVPGCHPGQ